MEKFTIVLLSAIFVTLIPNSVQFVAGDHLEPGIGIFKDQDRLNFTKTIDPNSRYEIYAQVEVRGAEGQLISMAETSHGNYIPHEISELAFYEMLGETEIVTIDNIKYEKTQYTDSPDSYTTAKPELLAGESDYIGLWSIQLCGEFDGHGHKCVAVFQVGTAAVLITQTDVVTIQWTILRVMN